MVVVELVLGLIVIVVVGYGAFAKSNNWWPHEEKIVKTDFNLGISYERSHENDVNCTDNDGRNDMGCLSIRAVHAEDQRPYEGFFPEIEYPGKPDEKNTIFYTLQTQNGPLYVTVEGNGHGYESSNFMLSAYVPLMTSAKYQTALFEMTLGPVIDNSDDFNEGTANDKYLEKIRDRNVPAKELALIDEFNAILSSIEYMRFSVSSTSPTSNMNTTGWKTFRNDKYNYEFRHPVDGSADYDVGVGGYVDKASVGFFNATTHFGVGAISADSTTYSNHPELFALSLEEYVQKLWQLQKDHKNPYNKPVVSDISQITVDGKVAYVFKESVGHVGFGSAGVLEKEMTYVFVRNNGVNFQIAFESEDLVASKILSTFKFTK